MIHIIVNINQNSLKLGMGTAIVRCTPLFILFDDNMIGLGIVTFKQ